MSSSKNLFFGAALAAIVAAVIFTAVAILQGPVGGLFVASPFIFLTGKYLGDGILRG